MKTTARVSISILAVLLLIVIIVFAINATDEEIHENTQGMLKQLTAQEGFSLKNFKEWPPAIRFSNYQEYKTDPAKWDQTLAENTHFVELVLKANEVGRVEIDPNAKFRDHFSTYKLSAHEMFLILVSQKVKQGKKAEAFDLLEKSNHFLVNIAGTPQSLINQLIAIACLKTNARFVKTLKDEGLKIPESLKSSFKLHKSARELFATGSQFEFLMISTAIDDLRKYGLEMTDIAGGNPSAFDRAKNFLSGKLFRPQQTLNWIADLQPEFLTEACKVKSLDECSAKYIEITRPKGIDAIINPVGRSFIEMFLARYTNTYQKFEYSLKELDKNLAEI